MTGIELIAQERARHEELGFDAIHDTFETNQELAVAAGLYALDGTYADRVIQDSMTYASDGEADTLWPWGSEGDDTTCMDKRGELERVRELTIAGALIAAEIDRLQSVQTMQTVQSE